MPEQLADETSFLRQLQAILRVRSHYGIATSRQIDIPEVSHRGMLVLVHQLADRDRYQLTVLNFANEDIAGTVRSEEAAARRRRSRTCSPARPSRRWTTCTASPSRCPPTRHVAARRGAGRRF